VLRQGGYIVAALALLAAGWFAYRPLLTVAVPVALTMLPLTSGFSVALRVAVNARREQPQRLVIDRKAVTGRVGVGLTAIRQTMPVKKLHVIHFAGKPGPDPLGPTLHSLIAISWDFTPILMAAALSADDAISLGKKLHSTVNRRLDDLGVVGHQRPTLEIADDNHEPEPELDRPPPGCKAEVLWDHNGGLTVELPKDHHSRGSVWTVAAVLAVIGLGGVALLIAYGMTPGVPPFPALWWLPTLLVAGVGFLAYRVWRDLKARARFRVDDDGLTVTRQGRGRRRHVVSIAELDEIELDTDGQKSWIIIHAHRRRKLKVLAGHPPPTLGWLAVLLRASTGLEGCDTADHPNA
ncbi:MAG: hypothetical protein AAF710_04900, partial [Planctomycetota bacterium]